jgi:hypothetical protein
VLVHPPKSPARFGTVDYCPNPYWARVFVDGASGDSTLFNADELRLLNDKELAKLEPATDVAAPPIKRAVRSRRATTSDKPKRMVAGGKNAELDAQAARGVMPVKPDITSPANQHYRPRFDKLEAMAETAHRWPDPARSYSLSGGVCIQPVSASSGRFPL